MDVNYSDAVLRKEGILRPKTPSEIKSRVRHYLLISVRPATCCTGAVENVRNIIRGKQVRTCYRGFLLKSIAASASGQRIPRVRK